LQAQQRSFVSEKARLSEAKRVAIPVGTSATCVAVIYASAVSLTGGCEMSPPRKEIFV
jgi:hypothetical protein